MAMDMYGNRCICCGKRVTYRVKLCEDCWKKFD